MILYRPVGQKEKELIEQSGFKSFRRGSIGSPYFIPF